MNPSQMESFFAAPMPFHPEELYKHVQELEGAFCSISPSNLNARTAVAKAIAAAVGAFVEGSLQEQGEAYVRNDLRGGWKKCRGLEKKWTFLKKRICPSLHRPWLPTLTDEEDFKRMKKLRNDVDHGSVVDLARLNLDDPTSHRRLAVGILAKIYESLGSAVPGWW